jgi:hypothetical protein
MEDKWNCDICYDTECEELTKFLRYNGNTTDKHYCNKCLKIKEDLNGEEIERGNNISGQTTSENSRELRQ